MSRSPRLSCRGHSIPPTNGAISAITSGDAPSVFTKDGVKYTSSITFSCTAGVNADCAVNKSGPAATATITSLGKGWRIDATAPASDEKGDPDYLTFGYWLYDPTPAGGNTGNDVVGAFASGNKPFRWAEGTTNRVVLVGKAEYRGSASGLHAYSGAVNKVQAFEAKASLTADFGKAAAGGGASTDAGSISGKIYEIYSGGTMLTDEIILEKSGDFADAGNGFGRTRMGTPKIDASTTPVTTTFKYNGDWDYQFFGPAATTSVAAEKVPRLGGGRLLGDWHRQHGNNYGRDGRRDPELRGRLRRTSAVVVPRRYVQRAAFGPPSFFVCRARPTALAAQPRHPPRRCKPPIHPAGGED